MIKKEDVPQPHVIEQTERNDGTEVQVPLQLPLHISEEKEKRDKKQDGGCVIVVEI